MDNNIILPTEVADKCCANLMTDASLDFIKQRPCLNIPKFTVLGNLEYGRLFTGDGSGHTLVALCGKHYNLHVAGKKLNVRMWRGNQNMEPNLFRTPDELKGYTPDPKCELCGRKGVELVRRRHQDQEGQYDDLSVCAGGCASKEGKIKCGHCKGKHHTPDEVRACHGVEAKPKTGGGDYFLRNNQVKPVSEAYVRRMWKR